MSGKNTIEHYLKDPNVLSSVMDWLPAEDQLRVAEMSHLFEKAVKRSVLRERPGWSDDPLGCLRRRCESKAGVRLMRSYRAMYLEGFEVAYGAKTLPLPGEDGGYVLIEGQVLTEVRHGERVRQAENTVALLARYPGLNLEEGGAEACTDCGVTIKRAEICDRRILFSYTGLDAAVEEVRRIALYDRSVDVALFSLPILGISLCLGFAAAITSLILWGDASWIDMWKGLPSSKISIWETITEAKRFPVTLNGDPCLVESMVGKVVVTNLGSGEVMHTFDVQGQALVALNGWFVGIASGKTFTVRDLISGELVHSRELPAPITRLLGAEIRDAFALRADQLYVDDLWRGTLTPIPAEARPIRMCMRDGRWSLTLDNHWTWLERWGWETEIPPPGKVVRLRNRWIGPSESLFDLRSEIYQYACVVHTFLKRWTFGLMGMSAAVQIGGAALCYWKIKRQFVQHFYEEMRHNSGSCTQKNTHSRF